MWAQTISMAVILLCCFMAVSVMGQEPIVYPAKGQSQDKMEKDRYQCYGWAKQQTGFDPMRAPAQQSSSSGPKSSALRGAAGGAALGAAGGAIAGDAGKGAAIGAATGGLIGGARSRREKKEEAQVRQTQAATYNNERAGYNRAFGACMEGRGYTVK